MHFFSAKHISEQVQAKTILNAIEQAFLCQASGDFEMPDRIHLEDQSNTHLLMPCFAGKYHCTKLVSVNPQNPKQNLPLIQGKVMLNDRTTGSTLAIFDAAKITALRTGAAAAIAVKYLSDPKASSLGLIGTGIQGIQLVRMISQVRPISQLNVFDYNPEKSKWFLEEIKKNDELKDMKIKLFNFKEELISNSEIMVLATTSNIPVLPNKPKILENKCFIGIGSFKPTMQEFSNALFPLLDQYFVDTFLAKKESGDLYNPLRKKMLSEDQVFLLSDLIAGKINLSGKTNAFNSVGMALFDLFATAAIYEESLQK